MGYDGEFTRTLAELDMPSPRKGIMRAFGGRPFSLADLPTVAPDAILFSQVALIQIKDPGKVETALDHSLKSLAIGGSIRVKKKSFRDFQIRQIHLKQGNGFPFVPAVAVYKNWLVVGFTPQAVQ